MLDIVLFGKITVKVKKELKKDRYYPRKACNNDNLLGTFAESGYRNHSVLQYHKLRKMINEEQIRMDMP